MQETERGGRSGDGSASRKAEHLRINIENDVRSKGVTTGFGRYRFTHCALPEIALADVDPSTTLFGRTLRAPILISCMTGGTPQAAAVNRTLARVAQEFGLAMGLGSGRVLIEHPETVESFDVRAVAPDVLLFANLGGVRDGIDAAKAIALGADLAGIAGPFLRAAAAGGGEAADLAREIIEVLRVAMFSLGLRSIAELRSTGKLVPV